ncbi:SDR family oxidoreductase [Parachlamydia sp. AcF125]|uniref:SDR family oxidoreductase n=1 Tax=Parachlamydia sp. AcF125 TaxID=2795736 RepID=UPI001BC9196E|nr:SDR family oxidoreductase [Parachlamydia sp. AcF125]MBS4168615.1 General stress protein 39 [Parachlamydia sp. AcF125]
MKKEEPKRLRPSQQQSPPGKQREMQPLPKEQPLSASAHRLENKVAIITGGDSGIGRSVAIDFAKEGADVVIVYLNEHDDAKETERLVQEKGKRCVLLAGDVGDEKFCESVVQKAISQFGKLDILVNNAGEQHPQPSIEQITKEQLERTFRTNIFAYFFMTKAAVKHLIQTKGTVINTASVTAYRGSKHLIDYSSTKGAIVAFTRSLALNLAEKGVRVNGVAPGPIWTPLIPSTFSPEKVETFGSDVPLRRAGEPNEVSSCYVFLASNDASFITGQFLHPNGGEIINT